MAEKTFTEVVGDVWDRALGVFDKAVDFELGKRELELQTDIQLFKSAQAFEDTRRRAEFNTTLAGDGLFGFSNSTLLIAAAVGVVGLFLLTR